MNNTIKTLILVAVLLVAGYLLMPYVKIKPKTPTNNNSSSDQNNNSNNSGNNNNNNNQNSGSVKTFSSDNFGVAFQYNSDQDGDGKVDTDAAEAGDKIYVYYNAQPKESGQWVQKFTKDPKDSLTTAIQKQFLTKYSSKDCWAINLDDYYKSFQVTPPAVPANVVEATIAYPAPTDPSQPFWQNSSKCPATYSATNGISYFWMDTNHPNEYFFFSIGQYGIASDTTGQKGWQDTFQVNK